MAEATESTKKRSRHGTRHRHTSLRTMAREAVFAVPRGMHLLLLVICFSLGFALATQVRAQRSDPLESLSEHDLVVLLDELNAQEDSLRSERNSLTTKVSQVKSQATQQEAAAEAAKQADTQARINAGTIGVHGPGVIMHVEDPAGALSQIEFVMTLGELRNAGAEAIELNGVRISTRSSFAGDAGHVMVEGQELATPYEWRIIGKSKTISTALEIQAGSAAQMRAKGAQVAISEHSDIEITSTAVALTPQFAQPH